jgi:hypothetical protein
MTLQELLTKYPKRAKEVFNKNPRLLEELMIVRFTAKIQVHGDTGLEDREIKDLVILNTIFYLDVKAQIDCILIRQFNAHRIENVTVHESI